MDDLYNNLKIYETEVKGSSSPSQNSQNVAFVSSNSSGSTNQAHGSNSANTDSMSDAKMAMLTMRARIFLNKTGRKISANGSETIWFNKSKWKQQRQKLWWLKMDLGMTGVTRLKKDLQTLHLWPILLQVLQAQILRAYKACLESVQARLDVYKKNEAIFEEDINILKLNVMLRDNALTELRKKFEKAEKEIDDLKLTLEKFKNSSKNQGKLLEIQVSDKLKTGVGYDSQVVDSQVFDSQVNDKYKTGEGYHAVPPPYTGNFMLHKSDLVLADEDDYVFSESVTSVLVVATSKAKTSELKPKESVKKVENNKQAKYPRKNSQSPRGNHRNWNNLMTQKLGSSFEFKNKACFVCGGFNHLIKDCDFYKKKMAKKPVWNNARRVDHQNSQRLTHPHSKRNFVPRSVLMKSGLKTLNTARQNSSRAAVSVNIARPINTAYPRPTVNYARPASNVFNIAHSHVRRSFNKFTTNKNNNLNEKVNTVRGNVTTVWPKAVVSDNKGHEANTVKASAC
ncbi:hypothetical protein Tco_0091752 [Tanacetum coccineum]